MPRHRFESWVTGELVLVALLAAATAVSVARPVLQETYELAEARLVLDTTIVLAATIVASLTAVRFTVEGRVLDLLLAAGFSVAAVGTFAFAVAPLLDGSPPSAAGAWAGIGARLLAVALIALAPFAPDRRLADRRRILSLTLGALAAALVAQWLALRWAGVSTALVGRDGGVGQPVALSLSLSLLALLWLAAVVGFARRFRDHREDLDSWLALAATLALFAELQAVLTPAAAVGVSQGDFLRVLAFALLLVGVWRAIRAAELGRAVAEERARVAREIHDGLAQYLFALSTHASMLEGGADLGTTLPKLKEAATAAQQEARFAVLALSSASGNASFDAALRRYVEFVTADGALDVELEVDTEVELAPDEQIEVFRIVQEGLANVRRHAGARHAEVRIAERGGRRTVQVWDDGVGFDEAAEPRGEGLKNMRRRTASIDGGFVLRSTPGRGTAVEVTLRA